MAKKNVTFADIAAYTGFSKTTISRYFNNPDSITVENQEKIANALEVLDYKENKLARVMANGKTEMVGVIIPNLYMHYYSDMLDHIISTYEEYGYKFIVFAGNEDADVERRYIQELLAYKTEGLIILSHTLPRMNYAINLGFGYKNFEIQIVGTGAAFFQTPMTNSYFWNGWGDGNYSAFVRDNIGGDYPRLAYTKSSNNFVQSDFWLRDGGWFKIQDVELAYTLPFKQNNKVGIRNIRFSLKGQNLATISIIKDVDPESIDAGVTGYPLFRIITAGIKFNF